MTLTSKMSVFAAIFLAAVFVPIASSRVSGSFPVPRLSLNLDMPPEERWEPVLKHWDPKELKDLFIKTLDRFVPPEALPLIKLVGAGLDDLLPYPYAGEIRGISKLLNLDIGQLTCVNLLYDIMVACTSIVAQDANGTIWHGKNMDHMEPEGYKNLIAILDVQSKGKTVYTATTFVGQVGIFTGMKPNKFTISLNERDKGSIAENIIEMLKALLFQKVKFTSFIIRDALENDNSFDDVLQRMVGEQQVSPVYFIVGGINPGEGVVITRERTYTLDVWHLDLSSNRWFLLETNYDHWTPPPVHDDRRDPGNKAMNAIGQTKINNDTMWDVLSIEPVLNNGTVCTAMMCAAKPDIYTSKIRTLPGA